MPGKPKGAQAKKPGKTAKGTTAGKGKASKPSKFIFNNFIHLDMLKQVFSVEVAQEEVQNTKAARREARAKPRKPVIDVDEEDDEEGEEEGEEDEDEEGVEEEEEEEDVDKEESAPIKKHKGKAKAPKSVADSDSSEEASESSGEEDEVPNDTNYKGPRHQPPATAVTRRSERAPKPVSTIVPANANATAKKKSKNPNPSVSVEDVTNGNDDTERTPTQKTTSQAKGKGKAPIYSSPIHYPSRQPDIPIGDVHTSGTATRVPSVRNSSPFTNTQTLPPIPAPANQTVLVPSSSFGSWPSLSEDMLAEMMRLDEEQQRAEIEGESAPQSSGNPNGSRRMSVEVQGSAGGHQTGPRQKKQSDHVEKDVVQEHQSKSDRGLPTTSKVKRIAAGLEGLVSGLGHKRQASANIAPTNAKRQKNYKNVLSDIPPEQQPTAKLSWLEWRLCATASGLFPGDVKRDGLDEESWNAAMLATKTSFGPPLAMVCNMLRQRKSQTRRDWAVSASHLVKVHYRDTLGDLKNNKPSVVAKRAANVQAILTKDGVYHRGWPGPWQEHYGDCPATEGVPFFSNIIPDLIVHNLAPSSVRILTEQQMRLFMPMPLQTIAFAATVCNWGLAQYKSGREEQIDFSSKEFKPIYVKLLAGLQHIKRKSPQNFRLYLEYQIKLSELCRDRYRIIATQDNDKKGVQFTDKELDRCNWIPEFPASVPANDTLPPSSPIREAGSDMIVMATPGADHIPPSDA